MESFSVATFRLGSTQQTGIGHYVDRLVAGLEARPDIDDVQVHDIRRHEVTLAGRRIGGHISHMSQLWQLGWKSIKADIIHAPHIPFIHAASASAMIHDAVWADYPTEYADTAFFVRRLKRHIRSLALVMSPSQAAAQSVQAALGLRRTPLVTHLAPDHDVFQGEGEKQGYALYAGELRPRKNVAGMVVAAAEAGLDVVRCGPQKPRDLEESQRCHDLAAKAGASYRDAGYVSRPELRDLYAGADALLYASAEEGFGLPPFEAAACGTQSILSPLPVFEELWPAGLAHFATHGLRSALQAAVDEPISSDRLVRHAKQFTWEATVDGHVKAWRRLIDQSESWCASPACDGCKYCLPIPGRAA